MTRTGSRIGLKAACALLLASFTVQAHAAVNPAVVDLGTAANYSILAETGITTTPGSPPDTAITGDIGVYTGTDASITGFGQTPIVGTVADDFSTSPLVSGNIYAANYSPATQVALATAVNHKLAAYNDAAGRSPGDAILELGAGTIGTPQGPLTRGVYRWSSGVNITTDLTLSGNATDVWIFVVAGALDVAADQEIVLTGGALASNVFWAVAGAATLHPGVIFNGNILCATVIAMQDGAVLHGRALAATAVTLIANAIDPASAPANSPTPSDTPTTTLTASPTPSATRTASPTPSVTLTASPTPSATRTASPTFSVTLTASPTPTATQTTSPTPSATRTASPTPSATPTVTTVSTAVPSGLGLGSAGYYGVLSSTFTRNGGSSTVSGDAGYSTLSGGGNHTASGTNRMPAPPQAGLDQSIALAALNAQACTFTFATGAIDLASDTTHGALRVYTPGVYCIIGAMSIAGGQTITLNGKGTYIFRSLGTFDTTDNSRVLLTGGADACDVFWVATQATTLGANTRFLGTVIDDAGITVGANTIWQGRALAFNGTVTLDTDAITALACATGAGTYTGPNIPVQGKSFVYPSPARGEQIHVVYNMAEAGKADLRVWNENGDLVARFEEQRPAGPQKMRVPIQRFAAGVYLYRVTLSYASGASEKTDLQKFAVLR